MTRALSIMQPWAWLIVNRHKPIENRSWHTNFRGHVLIHAGKKYSRSDHNEYAEAFLEDFGIELPTFGMMIRIDAVGVAHTLTSSISG